jgi:hypothetical protein
MRRNAAQLAGWIKGAALRKNNHTVRALAELRVASMRTAPSRSIVCLEALLLGAPWFVEVQVP